MKAQKEVVQQKSWISCKCIDIIYRIYSGNFGGCKFSLFGSRALSRNVRGLIFAVQCQETISLHVEYWCVGVYLGFIFCVSCSASKTRNFASHKDFPTYGRSLQSYFRKPLAPAKFGKNTVTDSCVCLTCDNVVTVGYSSA